MGSYISVEFSIKAILAVIPIVTIIQAACIYIAQKKL